MATDDPRSHSRRQVERRRIERRTLELQFMSPEWVTRIKQENLLWPKKDRRKSDRRNSLRRNNKSRRIKRTKRRIFPDVLTAESLLTSEEKKMLNDLMNEDNSE